MEKSEFHIENKKIKSIYLERDKKNNIKGIKNNLSNYNLLMYTKKILNFSKKNKLKFANLKIVDFGCGNGARLLEFLRLGADIRNLYGIDLEENRVKFAQKIFIKDNFTIGRCEKTALPSDYFDITLNATMMSSVNNEDLSNEIAREMIRVTRRGGYIIWLDLRYKNPFNINVRSYSKKEIKNLYKGCKFIFKTSTIIPLKIFHNLPTIFFSFLEIINIFNVHNLVFIRKL